MSKYYIPTIEEFHVGLNFEVFIDEIEAWIVFTYSQYTSFSEVIKGGWSGNGFTIAEKLPLKKVRVKTLDQSDIESLDYVLHRKDVTMGYDEYCHKRHKEVLPPGNDSNLNVILKKGNNVIVYKNLEIVFRGTIKNKSEFKRILKQLGI